MSIELGTVKVPMQISISAGNPAREVGTVTTEMTLTITGDARPIGASSVTVEPITGGLRTSVARALREAADEIERQADMRDRLYVDR